MAVRPVYSDISIRERLAPEIGMATVKFPRHGGMSLPRLCIVCGTRRCDFHEVYVRVMPTEGNLLPGGVDEYGQRVVGLTMSMPLCQEHESHFFWPNMMRWLGIGAIIAVTLLSVMIGSALGSFLFIPITVVLILGMVIGFFVLMSRMMRGNVHISDISRNYITFSGVSRDFARAYNEDDDRPRRRGDDDDEPLPRSTKGVGIGGLLAAFGIVLGILVLLVGIGLLVTWRAWPALGLLMNGPPGQKPAEKDGAKDGPKEGNKDGTKDGNKDSGKPIEKPIEEPLAIKNLPPVTPLVFDPTWKVEAMRRAYLSDMQEEGVITVWGVYGKGGMLGYPMWGANPNGNDPILVGGKRVPKGLSLVPRDGGFGRVIYKLGGKEKVLIGAAAMSDLPPEAGTKQAEAAMWFTVWGDGRLLWKSKPIQKMGDRDDFKLAVTGVDVLELRVMAPIRGNHLRSVWIDPAVHH